tara:strand:- start:1179 stop:1613 length:435 start_codon:yes stop_codon:yes gene_type:complete
MSSLKVDNITGRGSAGFTGSVKSEGGNTTTDLQQGLCKGWIAYALDSTSPVVADSFNFTVQTDHAAGDTTYAITSNMATAEGYTVSGKAAPAGDTTTFVYSPQPLQDGSVTTSSLRITVNYAGASAANSGDYDYVSNNIHGDLA